MASIVFFKPFVTIPPLPKTQQRASTHEAMALMSSGTIQKWSTLAADWPDVWNTISHVAEKSLSIGAVSVSFQKGLLLTMMHSEWKYIFLFSSGRFGVPQSGRCTAR